MAALTDAEVECVAFLQLPEAKTYADFGEDLAREVPEIVETLGRLEEAWEILLPSHPRSPASTRTNPSRSRGPRYF